MASSLAVQQNHYHHSTGISQKKYIRIIINVLINDLNKNEVSVVDAKEILAFVQRSLAFVVFCSDQPLQKPLKSVFCHSELCVNNSVI